MAINRLVKKIASRPSTEELILFIADDDEMTRASVELQKMLDMNNGQDLADLRTLCANYGISLETLFREIHRLLAIFAPEAISDEYAVLGLTPDANHNQVKKSFRGLSVKYHPDSTGGGDSDKFIEICQAYKNIINKQGSRPAASTSKNTSWRYRKKERGPSPQQKRTNIYLFTALASILFIISIIAPFFYKKNVMLKHLNTADPILTGRPEPVQQRPPGSTDVQSITDTVSAQAPDTPQEHSNIPEPETGNQGLYSTNDSQPVISANPLQREVPMTTVEVSASNNEPSVPKPIPAISQPKPETDNQDLHPENDSEPVISSDPLQQKEPIPAVEVSVVKNSHLVPKPIQTISQPTPQTRNLEPETRIQEPETKSPVPDLSKINRFIRSYTKTYESKDFSRFSQLFTTDALENGQPFNSQQEKYLSLFHSVDTITLEIAILSSTIQNQNLNLRGRFQIHLTYPQAKPLQGKGQIVFQLTENDQQYLIENLNYSFETSD